MVCNVSLGPDPPQERLCSHMGTLWLSLHGILAADPCFDLVGTVPGGSAVLCDCSSGVVVDLHERESGSTTISRKNVVDYSCAE